ncbi:acyl-CoA dehydrogenase family protein [Kocuria sp.]|uniref:acyl-CoA dehydrogenase family protein n=1 Tax=Kocuria sp. TaxID=1871328 RepID=UPI0026DEEA88|nr:acyl-CoA dehydrogenase family protein [Kocuria sp.]MDO5618854.1 acyl-CoA dehydrogenase family protein [Kocuria sp.]
MPPVIRGEAPIVESQVGIPHPEVDLFQVEHLLNDDERNSLHSIREVLRREVCPVVGEFWDREEFPFHLLPVLAKAGLGNLVLGGHSRLFIGLAYAEVARADVSLSALVGIHNELILGLLHELGSQAQKDRWLEPLKNFAAVGCFALTEPEHGSDIAGGLETTAERDGDEWVLNGCKRWIGAGTFADFAIVWARDTTDGQAKAFIVETDRPGWSATKIERKMGLRIMQNADIELHQVRIPGENLMPGGHGFAAANVKLRDSRAWVGWQGVGVQMAAFEIARDYAVQRKQFDRPLAKFQLMQSDLAKIMGGLCTSTALMARLAALQEEGSFEMVHAALAKSTTTAAARESAAMARNILGGNGVLHDYEISKIFNDVEILYTYEGTHEINSLIVGRAITGQSAFV